MTTVFKAMMVPTQSGRNYGISYDSCEEYQIATFQERNIALHYVYMPYLLGHKR
jgi:hypothetical protein